MSIRMLKNSAVLAAGAWLAACQPAAPPAEAPEAPAPAVAPAPAAPEAVTITREGEVLTFSFDAGRTLTATLVGPLGGAAASPGPGPETQTLAAILEAPSDAAPIIGYAVTSENFPADPLCGAAPTAAVAVLYLDGAPDKLAAFSGAIPGDAGAKLCNIRSAEVTGPPA
jgi:hypothetical protein